MITKTTGAIFQILEVCPGITVAGLDCALVKSTLLLDVPKIGGGAAPPHTPSLTGITNTLVIFTA